MINRYFQIVLFFLCILSPLLGLEAEPIGDHQKLSTHYILAIDNHVDNMRNPQRMEAARDEITKVLLKNGFSNNDYLTILVYSLQLNNPDFEHFATISLDKNNKQILWRQLKPNNNMLAELGDWSKISSKDNTNASVQALAKTYAIKAASPQNGSVANKTLVLMVTDGVANGVVQSYAAEYAGLKWNNETLWNKYESDVFNLIREEANSFAFINSPIKDQNGELQPNIGIDPYGKLYIEPFLALPTERPSISNTTNIPPSLAFQRVRGGYKLRMAPVSTNDRYLMTAAEFTIGDRIFTWKLSSPNKAGAEKWEVFVGKDEIDKNEKVCMRAWLKYLDGIYNGQEISPFDTPFQRGLTIRQSFKTTGTEKIFGIIPLTEQFWWWYPNDALRAVLIWDVVIVILFIIVVLFIGYRIYNKLTRFVPKNSDIVIENF